MNVVIDTDVVVSGLLKPFSPSGEIMRLIADASLRVCYDARVLLEYEQVLNREKFGFDPALIAVVLDLIKELGICMTGIPVKKQLPDPDDEMFIEIAGNPECSVLVTGNSRHFPKKSCGHVQVMTPREFVTLLKGGETGRQKKSRT